MTPEVLVRAGSGDSTTVAEVRGTIDMWSGPYLAERLGWIIYHAPGDLLLDFGEVDFIDENGAEVVADALREAALIRKEIAISARPAVADAIARAGAEGSQRPV